MKLRFVLSVLVVFCLLSLRPALAREWTDSSGTHKIEAELVKLDGEVVHLKKPDGAIVKIPLSKLCEDDRKLIQQQSEPGATSKKAQPEPGPDQVIASDDHRSSANRGKHLIPEYVLRSSRPQQLSHTEIRYRISCRPGWTTSGDVEACVAGGAWAKIASWNTSAIDDARDKDDWHTASLRDVQSNGQATEIRVRFTQRGGEHSLAVSHVVWKSDSAQVVGKPESKASPATSQPASPQDAPSKTAISPAPEKPSSSNVAAKPDSAHVVENRTPKQAPAQPSRHQPKTFQQKPRLGRPSKSSSRMTPVWRNKRSWSSFRKTWSGYTTHLHHGASRLPNKKSESQAAGRIAGPDR